MSSITWLMICCLRCAALDTDSLLGAAVAAPQEISASLSPCMMGAGQQLIKSLKPPHTLWCLSSWAANAPQSHHRISSPHLGNPHQGEGGQALEKEPAQSRGSTATGKASTTQTKDILIPVQLMHPAFCSGCLLCIAITSTKLHHWAYHGCRLLSLLSCLVALHSPHQCTKNQAAWPACMTSAYPLVDFGDCVGPVGVVRVCHHTTIHIHSRVRASLPYSTHSLTSMCAIIRCNMAQHRYSD